MTKDRNFSIGKVSFELVNIPAMAQWDIAELLREALGNGGALTAPGTGEDPLKFVAALMASLDRKDVLEIRDALFEHVRFKSPDQLKPMPLAGLEDSAFVDAGFSGVYEVMARAIHVNFTGCLTDLVNRLGLKIKPAATSDSVL